MDYHEETSPTPGSAPVKITTAAANGPGLPFFHLDVSQTFVQAPHEGNIHASPSGVLEAFVQNCQAWKMSVRTEAGLVGSSIYYLWSG